MDRRLTWEEKTEIGKSLIEHHGVFYEFWKMVTPKFSEKIPTAAVSLNQSNKCLDFLINEDFWNTCNLEKKAFLISHEASHLIQSAGIRTNGKCDEAKNVALDIPVNEALIKYFGFNRSNVDPQDQFCWMSNVFPPDLETQLGRAVPPAPSGKSFEFYYDLLKKQDRMKPSGGKLSFNNHDKLLGNEKGDGCPAEDIEEFLDHLIDSLDEASAESLKEILNRQESSDEIVESSEKKTQDVGGKLAGKNAAGIIARIEKKFVVKKPKWETIIKKWAKKFVEKDFEVNHWLIKNRRFALLPSSLMLPNDIDTDDRLKDKEKMQVFVMMDYSGSCVHHAKRFYRAFDSIPKTIKVRLFSFDTYCTELNKKERQMVGGGGTTFTCIEDKVQEIVAKEKIKYPWVWVLTDGIANVVEPEKPKNWTFLLTMDYRRCIPEKSKIYDLSEFE
jgi:hypothetical protein